MNRHSTQGAPPIELVEHAVHVLRRLPATAHLAYLVGTVPFLLSLVWFWADMSRGAQADRRCAGESLVVALLYVWMKTWHGVYGSSICSRISAHAGRRWTGRRWLQVLGIQAMLQPLGLLLVPLSVLPLMLPFPWVVAFFQHLEVLTGESEGRAWVAIRAAAREAKRWPGQNHGLIGLLLLAGTVMLINVTVVLAALPYFIKMFTGLESDFTLSTVALVMNWTFLLCVLAVTYLIGMPLVLAVYARRGFEGAAVHSGADLRSEIQGWRVASRAVPALLASFGIWLAVGTMTALGGVGGVGPGNARGVVAAKPVADAALDQAIDRVLDRPDFTWRERRELAGDDEELEADAGVFPRLGRWLQRLGKSVDRALSSPMQGLGRGIRNLLDWLFSSKGKPGAPSGRGADEVDWITGVKILIYLVVAGAVAWLAWFGARLWQRRRPRPVAVVAAAAEVPDLTAENVSAAALPEDGWLALARDLAGRGEFRQAIRAIYLAELAHLAQRELVRLAEAKSNRDYLRELDRRARGLPGVRDAFAETVSDFDRVWYGRHEATAATLERTEARMAELRSAA